MKNNENLIDEKLLSKFKDNKIILIDENKITKPRINEKKFNSYPFLFF